MRRLRYTINVTLDGCCDHRAGRPGPELHRHAAEGIARAGLLLFGRVVYTMMEEAWRPAAETGVVPDWMDPWMVPFAHVIHAAPKIVVSDTLRAVDWNARLVPGHALLDTVRQLKSEPGGDILTGGVRLPRALAEAGLIDEYEFIMHFRVAGKGPSLLSGLSRHLDLKLVDQQPVGPDALAMVYRPAG